MTPFVDRMIRAAKIDLHLYEEVEAENECQTVIKTLFGIHRSTWALMTDSDDHSLINHA